jgi:hypothetical protein
MFRKQLEVAVVAALLCAPVGCTSINNLQNAAARSFTADHTCPRDRMVLTRQPNAPAPAKQPPEGVARDPERLAVWNQKAAKEAKEREDWETWAVQGCGHDAVYACSWSANPDGTSAASCVASGTRAPASR